MNRNILGFAAGAAALVAGVTPAVAGGWKLVPQGTPAHIADTSFSVTPGEDWNRQTYRPVHEAETWSLDGPSLNNLYLVAGLETGKTLFRDGHKKDKPLPQLGANLQLTDIPDFVESSMEVATNNSGYVTDKVEPAQFAGHPGILFQFHYIVANSPLRGRGLAEATVVGGKLYLILFSAPELYYFEHNQASVMALMGSAKL